MKEICDVLQSMGEESLRQFNARLIPNIPADIILGIRIPALRKMAVELGKGEPETCRAFLSALPHHWLEENLLHALLINQEKGFHKATTLLEQFLPFVDNWAVCDILSPKSWKAAPDEAMLLIRSWLSHTHPYTVRFAMEQLMTLFAKDRFQPDHLHLVKQSITDHYYVGMMAAWYYAEVMSHHPETVYDFLSKEALPAFVWGKSIQKSLESRKVSPEWKASLRSLRTGLQANG